ncbi:hypothetical protein [Paenarthrobacter nitroguajacolicus]|uniref:hypothetical protein n=1 Tax=Paenarthrobacter nitroguajacolicus TaxID=211146 RepID=UPI00248B1EB3|nr:hypothetical protein [Paenarthrobacter nitroguajacolicus]
MDNDRDEPAFSVASAPEEAPAAVDSLVAVGRVDDGLFEGDALELADADAEELVALGLGVFVLD